MRAVHRLAKQIKRSLGGSAWRAKACEPATPASIYRLRLFHAYGAAFALPVAAAARLEQLRTRHADLCSLLSGEGAAALHHRQQAELSRELGELQPVVDAAARLERLARETEELRSLAAGGDRDFQRLAAEELEAAAEEVPKLEEAVLLQLLPSDATDDRDVILEVRAGTGGDEASLFAADLFRMYTRFVQLRGWSFEIVEAAESEASGGLKTASASIAGPRAYGLLKFESGIHRVQRVPATESQGRIHTSAASVVVLPQADEVDVELRDEDVRIDTYRSSGAGGQHVNTTNSAVRVTHVPTGIAVAIQDERSQHKNKAKALKVLRAKLFDVEQLRQQRSLSADRRELIGSGDRSERVRTYNYPQGRVTDHRVGVTEHNLPSVMSGERLHVFTDALQDAHKARLLASMAEQG